MSGELATGVSEIDVVPDNVVTDEEGEDGNADNAYPGVAQSAGEQCAIWMTEVKDRLVEALPNPNRCLQPTIFIVPDNIRSCDPTAYTPQVVSIGPYHRNTLPSTDITSSIQHYKRYCVRFLLSRRCGEDEAEACQLLNQCLAKLEALIGNIRSCYSADEIDLDDHELAEIMLYDGCFIMIRRLLKQCEHYQHTEHAHKYHLHDHGYRDVAQITITNMEGSGKTRWPLLGMPWNRKLVEYDLLKLENQIPFFVIDALHQLLKTNDDKAVNLFHLAFELFNEIRPTKSSSFIPKKNFLYLHLLHLFYSSLLPWETENKKANSSDNHVHKNNQNSLLH